jgi:protein-disulfide isomerase/uncharacterized membrane protein
MKSQKPQSTSFSSSGCSTAAPPAETEFQRAHASRSKPRGIIALWVAVALACVGIGLAVELTRLHVAVHTNPAARSFCSLKRGINCLNVAESSYSIVLGVPVSVWAIFGELALLAAALTAALTRRRLGSGVLFWGAAIGVAVGVWLSYVSAFRIGSLCLLCSALEGVNVALWVTATLHFRARRIAPDMLLARDARFFWHHRRWTLPGAAVGLAALAALSALYPPYWKILEPNGPGGLPHGFTAEGHAWIGARRPRVTIVEFTDFQCPFCRMAHSRVRLLVTAHARTVRLVHRDFPLDHHCNHMIKKPYHPRACELARAARCAGRQHKFWEMADLIFARRDREGGPNPEALAFRLGLDRAEFNRCMQSPAVHEHIQADILESERLKLSGTPSYFLNGRKIRGWPKLEQIKSLLAKKPQPPEG